MSVHLLRSSIESKIGNTEELKSFWGNQNLDLGRLSYREVKERERTWDKYYEDCRETIACARFKKIGEFFRAKQFDAEFRQLIEEAKNADPEVEMPSFLDPNDIRAKYAHYVVNAKSKGEKKGKTWEDEAMETLVN